jgi:hypothetical protein
MKRVRRSLVGVSVLGALVLGMVGPAAAHKVSIEVTGQQGDDGKPSGVAYVEPPHKNSAVKFVLKKKNAEGNWVAIQRMRQENQISQGVYLAYFGKVAGDKQCKIKGTFIATDHAKVSDASPAFDC